MNEIRLYKSPKKALRLLALCLPFVVIGIWMILKESHDATDRYMGGLVTCFFGLGIVIGLINLFDRSPQLVITEKWIWDRSTKLDPISWEHVIHAYPFHISGQDFISLVLDKTLEKKFAKRKWLQKMNKAIGAQTVNLHLGQVKVDTHKLSRLILALKEADGNEKRRLIESTLHDPKALN